MVISGTKVLLVSHRQHVCAQLRLRIESWPGLVVVGEAANYLGALAIAAVEAPDFIVVDVAADDEGALDHISDLVHATKHVLIISDICEEMMLNCVKRAGATDLVPRDQAVPAIIRRLDLDREGLVVLTDQELIVIELVARGLSNERIAGLLMISETVVSEALDSIFQKLGVQDRLELLIYSLSNGLASLE